MIISIAVFMLSCSNPLVNHWYNVSACPNALLISIVRPVLLSLLIWVTTFHNLVIIVLIATAPGGYVTFIRHLYSEYAINYFTSTYDTYLSLLWIAIIWL